MKVAVTIRTGDDIAMLRQLLEQVRAKASVTVLQAPTGIDYSYPFPIVSVGGGARHFGQEAVDVLKELVS